MSSSLGYQCPEHNGIHSSEILIFKDNVVEVRGLLKSVQFIHYVPLLDTYSPIVTTDMFTVASGTIFSRLKWPYMLLLKFRFYIFEYGTQGYLYKSKKHFVLRSAGNVVVSSV